MSTIVRPFLLRLMLLLGASGRLDLILSTCFRRRLWILRQVARVSGVCWGTAATSTVHERLVVVGLLQLASFATATVAGLYCLLGCLTCIGFL